MSLFKDILEGKEKIAVIGMGYVGMPLAVEFAKKVDVIGFDINKEKIELYRKGIDKTNEVGDNAIKNSNVVFTFDEFKIKSAKFHIIAVPTPISSEKTPNLDPLISSSITVGKNLVEGSIVVYESTVYPGVTEDVCIPILEKESGLKCGVDFKVGYSPERINPSDKINTLTKIVKIVSGMDEESLEEIAKIYELIIEAGVYKTSSIKAAEAAKVVENSQRDVNIAFMNELAIVFDKMGIDTKEVIEAMNTKWNALKFYPGLVGGHCIGVDPYYFAHGAKKSGYNSEIILSGRKINDNMGKFIADVVIKKLVHANKVVKKAKIAIFGVTFKENCSDTRNSKVFDIVARLNEYRIHPILVDSIANCEDAKEEHSVDLVSASEIKDIDCLIFAVAHDEYKEMTMTYIEGLFRESDNKKNIIIDIKSILDKEKFEKKGYSYWRL